MAVYKVPQDVEADDKLIGPFSFRQFIYLIIVAISGAAAWGLSQVFLALAILPMPIIIFFLALSLPLRKDQPMETYLSAVVSFYFLKPRKRFWQPDGINSFVTIIPPKDADKIYTKGFGEDEATRRLSYLADLVDTHGWAIRGTDAVPDTSVNSDLYYESQQAPDMMDSGSPSAQALTQQLASEADQQRQDAIAMMQTVATQVPVAPDPSQPVPNPAQAQGPVAAPQPSVPDDTPIVSTLPSIDEIRARQDATAQKRIDEAGRDAVTYATLLVEEANENRQQSGEINNSPSTSASTPATGTMELTFEQANELSQQTDVSVQTLAHEANRVAEHNKTLKDGEEVTISFH